MSDDQNELKVLYHGTAKDTAKIIIERQEFKITKPKLPFVHSGRRNIKKNPGTLGYGVYFFSSKDMTIKFSEKIKDYKIIEAKVELKDDTTLNLTNEQQLERYNLYKEGLARIPIFQTYVNNFKNGKRQSELEGILIEHLLQDKKFLSATYGFSRVDCVIGFTVTDIKTSESSTLANSIEYCIKNFDSIKEIKYYDGI